MNFIENERPEKSPYVQLLTLALYAIAGLVLTYVVALSGLYFWYGEMIDPSWLSPGNPKFIIVSRTLISLQQFGLFLFPALLMAWGERQKIPQFYHFKKIRIELLLLVILIMVLSMPTLEWVTQLNQQMVLPEFLKPIEQWMKTQEDSAMATTLELLKMNRIGDYLINIALIALLPAIAEEFMFRGAIQRALGRMFQNPHFVIWLTAFIFSAIHVQFYGFLPRLLLGAAFGYIYFWTKSLWYSIFAHFLNNAYAVTAAWYMQKNNIPLSESDKTTYFQWYGYLISAVLTFLVFKYFKNKSRTDGKQLDKSI
ncbi:CPBP family intramembrane glutamic endopeptidase [Pedobacter gandavensis]|uniref:CPBP family intramembrane metalloprotease n=1 Tax=Pedobacter gandavensis TaxID=2679963 RepID=A0ABR6EY53_9SPHI|nr:CPBP family intramembrane glutamic endopeptidase [Pedobacter gandavensis]MBB2150157.1 CPBP family intramembrane metalloprotease [Pedobacter gandavensis]